MEVEIGSERGKREVVRRKFWGMVEVMNAEWEFRIEK
jgi:hypothetical protein